MITLNSTIQLSALNRLDVTEILVNFRAQEARIALSIGRALTIQAIVRNGACTGIKKNPNSNSPADVVVPFNLDCATGYTDLIRNGMTPQKIEQSGIVAGWIDLSLGGTVE